MGTTAKAYSLATPAGSDLASLGDEQFRDDKTAVDERYKLEHNTLVAAAGASDTGASAAGRHKPGIVACNYIGTYAQIAALTGMVTGAIAYDTTNNRQLTYNGTNWTTYPITALYAGTAGATASFSANLSTASSISPSAYTAVVGWTNNSFGIASSAFNLTTGIYTVPVTGYYQINATLGYIACQINCTYSAWLYINGNLNRHIGSGTCVYGGEEVVFGSSMLLTLAATWTLQMYTTHNSSAAKTLDNNGVARSMFSGNLVRIP